jgi:Uma2 family endonuclease
MNAPVSIPSDASALRKARFTLESFRMAWDAGVWPEYPAMELIDGEVYLMPADGWRTSFWNAKINTFLVRNTDDSLIIVPDKTLAVGEDGLKPDFWIAPADKPFAEITGADCLLVIEVSDTTIGWDRKGKAARYALGGVGEYWVVDVAEACTLVFRLGADGSYGEPEVVPRDVVVSPLAMPQLGFQLSAIIGED